MSRDALFGVRPRLGRMPRLLALVAASAVASLGPSAATGDAQQAAPAAAETGDPVLPGLTSEQTWRLPDALVTKLEESWQPRRNLYLDRGNVSIRANAMLLEIHALAALAGHEGASRQDARIPGLVRFFTTAPVYVTKTTTKRDTGSFPHAPAWESVYRSDSTKAVLHPSADAIVARALATAWRARDVAGIPAEDSQRIQQVIGAVARGKFYDAPNRAENQINWNTDVYAANLEVNGDRSRLPDYRAHLKWFVDHAFRPAYKGGSSNLSAGFGFRYLPQYKGGNANKMDTVEYANLVHSALGFYQTAVNSGMRPLSASQVRKLQQWSRHILFGTWTHGGYLNWDSGLGTARRNQQQYWAFALDALVKSVSPGALLSVANQRAYVRSIVEQGLLLYSRIGWPAEGPFPTRPTAFGAPNGFPEGTKSPLITPLRMAIVAAELDVRLPSSTAKIPPNMYAHDAEFGRLAVSTESYNTAVIKPVAQAEGGLDLSRLFDSRQRPLTTLGAGSLLGAAPGIRLARGSATVLDDQPGTQTRWSVPGIAAGSHRNRSGTFKTLVASGLMKHGKARIDVRHAFTKDAISTTFKISRGAATNVTLRMPVWGASSTIEAVRGATLTKQRFRRSGNGSMLFKLTTPEGGTMYVAFRGVPRKVDISVVRITKGARNPDGARELRLRFKADRGMTLRRRIAVVAAAPLPSG
ncbi:MAG: hypothetical protein J7513_12130 [Solirubrobacteraceae bacterium]|nr:hypothetical protein [Solirubrobacteraceae bacterium]